VRAFCDANALTLGSVSVAAPPPPDAPNAIADVAQTDEGQPVNIDVLSNDTPNAALAIDKDSLAITSDPGHGSAKVNTDHTVTYTPAAGFAGTDTFTYKLCSAPEPATTTSTSTTTTVEPDAAIKSVAKPQAAAQHCDTADVTVTVLAPQQVATAPGGASSTPTTVAAELPHTGSSDTPLALLGLGLVALGLAVTGVFARRRRLA
jgi:LPXTG-motif cell wall-anchored protein